MPVVNDRKIPVCISFPPDLWAWYKMLGEVHDQTPNKLIIELLTRIKDKATE